MQQCRHQIGQGLARAGARLDQQVFAGIEGRRNGFGHLYLAGALLPAERGHSLG